MTALIAVGSEATPIQPPLGPSSAVVGMELSTPTARIVLGQAEAHQAVEGAQGLGGPVIVPRDRTTLIIDGSAEPFGDPWEVGPLTIRLPLHVRGDTPVDLDRKVEDLMEALRSRYAGGGGTPAKTRLTVTRADGSVRWIEGWRQQDADLTPRRTSLHSRVLTVELRCPDPWPMMPLRQSTFAAGGGVTGSALPISVRTPPIFRLSRSVGFGVPRELLVGGQVAAPVEWTITGPCTEVTVESAAGRRWRLDATLAGGETAKVYADDRRPGSGLDRVLVNDSPAWSSLVERDLFHLLPDTDTVTVTVAGAGADTRVVAEWNPRAERLA